jgi:hypothetical protein
MKEGLVRHIAQTDWIQLSSKNDQSESNACGGKKNQQTIFLGDQKMDAQVGHAKILAQFSQPAKPEKKVNRYRKTVVEPSRDSGQFWNKAYNKSMSKLPSGQEILTKRTKSKEVLSISNDPVMRST